MLSRRHFLLKAGLATPFLSSGYAFGVEPQRLVATRYRISPENWPAGLVLRIAVLADIHAINPWMSPAHIERITHATNALEPDIVLLAGDYEASMPLYGVGSYVSMEDCAKALSLLRAPLGVHAVLGNHDLGRRGKGGDSVRRAFAAHGIPVMENVAVRLEKTGRGLWLLGLGDQWGGIHHRRLDDLPGTLAQMSDDSPAILLAHEPDIFAELAHLDRERRIALTVCGHTHGGQVSFPFYGPRGVPSRYGRRFAYGHIVEDNRHLVVSGGLGMTGVPVRFGVPPEIVMITLDGGGSPVS
ncbi:metallophosphoesterase [Labrys okinawensis]|uniref:Metallophosphoesterase n=1 Tax=Labrys okinawensis TaxID=346911 RepID=A0A2S9QFU9_9HYPH|nr:metallophosphoesterase [Labrys okinawensis]PRH88205.1 metallophosphoesterase [Labrys okinawensis]